MGLRMGRGKGKTQNEAIHGTHPRAQQKHRPNPCASGSSQESWPVFLPKMLATLWGRRGRTKVWGKRQDVDTIALDPRKA